MERQEFTRQLQELQTQVFHTIVSYEVYIAIWPNEQIIDVFNRHRGFMIPVRNSLYQTMMMGFAKIFDRDRRTMSLVNLIDIASKNMDKLVPGLSLDELQSMNEKLSQHESSVETLKRLRDQHLAHLDAYPKDREPLPKGELDSLIDTIGEVLDKLALAHNNTGYDWSFQKRRSSEQTSSILKILQNEMDQQKAETDKILAELNLEDEQISD